MNREVSQYLNTTMYAIGSNWSTTVEFGTPVVSEPQCINAWHQQVKSFCSCPFVFEGMGQDNKHMWWPAVMTCVTTDQLSQPQRTTYHAGHTQGFIQDLLLWGGDLWDSKLKRIKQTACLF